jgi:hypothetical protein
MPAISGWIAIKIPAVDRAQLESALEPRGPEARGAEANP